MLAQYRYALCERRNDLLRCGIGGAGNIVQRIGGLFSLLIELLAIAAVFPPTLHSFGHGIPDEPKGNVLEYL
ncbi:hypothetical protein [Corynebacterium lowii]|uniref:hypothetical protein n=1 Tax=Corynebacterium lowii TaxID=1544413 RepID=UPI0006DD2E0E|nr:hypothetical protein [Corynebacterium lowii]MDP9851981.1 hypothetical protein [Corynebacterium lowii]